MNIIEFVALSSDTNFIPVKYAVIDVTVGTASSSTYLWLKVVSYGIDTESHYNDYLDSLNDGTVNQNGAPDGLQGTLKDYLVTSLDNVKSYHSAKGNHSGSYPIG